VNITENAKGKLLEILGEHNAKSIRIFFAGFG
jgi:hypothetical protein